MMIFLIVLNGCLFGDGNYMDFNLINQGIGFFVEFDDFVIFFLDGEVGSRFEFEWWRGVFVSFEFKYCYNFIFGFNYVIVIIFYRCNVFIWIIQFKLLQ